MRKSKNRGNYKIALCRYINKPYSNTYNKTLRCTEKHSMVRMFTFMVPKSIAMTEGRKEGRKEGRTDTLPAAFYYRYL